MVLRRKAASDELLGLEELIWGITGERPTSYPFPSEASNFKNGQDASNELIQRDPDSPDLITSQASLRYLRRELLSLELKELASQYNDALQQGNSELRLLAKKRSDVIAQRILALETGLDRLQRPPTEPVFGESMRPGMFVSHSRRDAPLNLAEFGIDTTPFTVRSRELEILDSTWSGQGHETGVQIIQLVGPAGVGKTSLVKHWLSRFKGAEKVFAWSFSR